MCAAMRLTADILRLQFELAGDLINGTFDSAIEDQRDEDILDLFVWHAQLLNSCR